MALHAMTAEDRCSPAYDKTSFAIFGPFGVGKTSLLKTLPPEKTLTIDIEGGLKAIRSWREAGPSIKIDTFPDFQDLIALIAGPKQSAPPSGWLGQAHCDHVRGKFAGSIIEQWTKLPIIFVDSITVLTRLALAFAQQQPEAFSEKTGKADIRGAYGLLGCEVLNGLQHLQCTLGKTIIFVGLLEKETDDYGRITWEPQMEGSKIGRNLPGIVDEVVTMHTFVRGEDGSYALDENAEERRLVCRRGNPFGLPAKTRAGGMGVTEAPDLGALLTKINSLSAIQ